MPGVDAGGQHRVPESTGRQQDKQGQELAGAGAHSSMQELPLREGMGSAQECQDLVYSGKMLKEGRQEYHAEPVWQTEDGSGDDSLWGALDLKGDGVKNG